MSSSATGVGMPICFLWAILLILTQKSSQKFGDVLGIMRYVSITIVYLLGSALRAALSSFALLWRLLTSHGKLYSASFVKKKLFEASVRPPRIRALSFHLIPTSFTPTIPNSNRTLICDAILSMVKCLI